MSFLVTFNQSVTGVTTSAFSLTQTGTASGTIASVTGSGSAYTVTVTPVSGSGTLRLDLTNTAGITGTPAAFRSGQAYVVAPGVVPIAWGANSWKGVGNNSTTDAYVPVAVYSAGALAGKVIAGVAPGGMETLALATDGTVYAWGTGSLGELGNNAFNNSAVPVAVDMSTSNGSSLAGKTVIAIAGGYRHCLALASDGAVYAWGGNYSGQLGNNNTTSIALPEAVDTTGVMAGKTIVAIAAGYDHSLALASDGTIYAWGYNSSGQLGNNTTTTSSSPVAVSMSGALAGKTVVAIAAGGNHSLALASDGTVFSWGSNGGGQLGNNSTSDSSVPVAVDTSAGDLSALSGRTVVAIAAGESHSVALAGDGTICGWGGNGAGQLGNSSTNSSSVPVAATMTGVLAGKTVVAIAAGSYQSLALASDGTVYSWGYAANGQLGNNSTASSSVPVAVDTSGSDGSALVGMSVAALGTGAETYCGLVLASPSVAVTSIARSSPGPVAPTGTSVTFLVAFNQSVTGVTTGAFALTTTGSASGTIASVAGSGTAYTVTVNALSGFGTIRLDLASGSSISGVPAIYTWGQSYALSASTIAAGWGYNGNGELGNNSRTNSSVPVAVDQSVTNGSALAGKTVVAVAPGDDFTLALASDGTVYAWGDNTYGELGNGTTTRSVVPTAVTMTGALSGKTVVGIAAGDDFALALTSDGLVYGWGRNANGQLGNGTTTNASTPVAVSTGGVLSGKAVVAIAAGYYHSLALASDGTVYSWGESGNGQLGSGAGSSYSPVAVNTSGVLAGRTIVAITAGGMGSAALASDGRVYDWGYNGYGQLGNGSSSDSNVPVAVDTSDVLLGKSVVAIAAGAYHFLALASDGTVASWGDSSMGELGNGSRSRSSVPVAVSTTGVLTRKTIVAIGAGYDFSLALAADGTVFSWGYNDDGGLGNASTSISSVPVAVNTSNGVSALYDAPVCALGAGGNSDDDTVVLASPTALSVNAVSPTAGTTAGGTSVTISGTHFTGATAVKFGSTAAASFTVVSDTSITAITTASAFSTVDVTVRTAGGTSFVSSSDRFTYGVTPAITSTLTASGTYGSAISTYTITASNSPTSYGAAGLPPGLSVNTGNGQITGTPTSAAGSPYSVTLSATNTVGTGTATLVFTISKATTTIATAPTASGITYGQTLASSTLSGGTASAPGSFAFTNPTAAPGVGTSSQGVTFTPSDTGDYTSATATVSVTTAKATPVITWAAPSAITYGTALSAVQLDATASTAGAFTYTDAGGTILDAGAQTLAVSFVPSDLSTYNTASASVSLTVAKAAATLALGNLAQAYDGTAKVVSVQTTPAGLSVIIIYVGAAGTPVTPGQYTVRVSVIDPDYWGAATATMTISPAAQAIAFPSVSAVVGVPVTLVATAGSGLPVNFSLVSGNASLSGSVLTISDTNPVTVTASQGGNGNYLAAPGVTQVITASSQAVVPPVNPPAKQSQTISFAQPLDQRTNSGPFGLSATASSGLPVTFVLLSGPATVNGSTVTLTGVPGAVSVQASQAGNAAYSAATPVTVSFNVLSVGAQTYFGNITGGSSGSAVAEGLLHAEATASPSSFAAYLMPNGTAGTILGYLSGPAEGFVASFSLDSLGNFTAKTSGILASGAAGSSLTFSGRVASGLISGTIQELGASFSATVDPASGSSSSLAGLYQGSALQSASGTTYSVVGTQGNVYVLAVSPTMLVAGAGTLSSADTFTVTASQSATITGSINPASASIADTVTTASGATTSYAGIASTATRTDRLINFSSRGYVGTGQSALVAGFVIGGSGKTVLLRAAGPALASFGVQGVLARPVLTLYDASGSVVATNGGWNNDPTLAAAFAQAGAFAYAQGSLDAAALATLPSGTYTLQVSGGAGTTGIALAEVYDTTATAQYQKLVNISSRGQVGPGSAVLVDGFVVTGNSPKKMLIRGVGPTLGSNYGMAGSLSDPILGVYDSSGNLLAQNDNWGAPLPVNSAQVPASASDLAAAAAAVGAFPLVSASKDSALIVTLPPGDYTAQVSGVAGASGIALVEIYEIAP